jgi:hypothetical protein
MSAPCPSNNVSRINDTECLSDSRTTLNKNFENIDTTLYQVSSIVTGKTGASVGKIIAGTGITVYTNDNSGTGDVTISTAVCPYWFVGKTNKPLYEETPSNRVSMQYLRSDLVLQHLQSIVAQNYPMPGSETVTFLEYDYGIEQDKYVGSRLLMDGRVYLAANYLDTAKIYDPFTNTIFESKDKSYPEVHSAHSSTVYLPNGRVYLTPFNTIYSRIYDPGQDTLTVIPDTNIYNLPGGFSKGILTPSGEILHIPYNSTKDIVYNPYLRTIRNSQGSYPGDEGYIDGVLLPDNKILLIPYRNKVPALFDLNVDFSHPESPIMPLTFIQSTVVTGEGWFSGGVMLSDGRVFLVPTNRPDACIFDPVTRVFTPTSGEYPLGDSSIGGCLLVDGRVLITPKNNHTIKIYDPRTDTLHDTGIKLGPGTSHAKGIVLGNGDVFFAPKDSRYAAYLQYYHQNSFSLNYLTGLYI